MCSTTISRYANTKDNPSRQGSQTKLAKANLIKAKLVLGKNKNSLLRKLTGDFHFLKIKF
jgi:hypothetical protein